MTKLETLNILTSDTRRRDAYDKVTGRANYTTDVTLPNMLHAKVLRSPMGHARIIKIDSSSARKIKGVYAVLTREDIKKYSESDTDTGRNGQIKTVRELRTGTIMFKKGTTVVAIQPKSGGLEDQVTNERLAGLLVGDKIVVASLIEKNVDG